MQSTGHSSTQARSFRSTHGCAMTYVTRDSPRVLVCGPWGSGRPGIGVPGRSGRTAVVLVSRFPPTDEEGPRVMDIALDRARLGERWEMRCRLADGAAT